MPPQDWRAALPAEYKDNAAFASYKDLGGLLKSHLEAQKMIGYDKVLKPKGELLSLTATEASISRVVSRAAGPVALNVPVARDSAMRIVHSARSRESMNWTGSVGAPGAMTSH